MAAPEVRLLHRAPLPSRAAVVALTALLLAPALPLALVGGSTDDRAAFQLTTTTFAGDAATLGIIIDELPETVIADGFSVQDGLNIDSASMMAAGSGHPLNGSYLRNIEMDIGQDGDIDWAFEGAGYGALGMQDIFSNGQLDANATVLSGAQTNTSFGLWLPKNATVTQATGKATVMAVNVAIECPPGGADCDEAAQLVTMLSGMGFAARVVNPTDIDTVGELAGYTTVMVGGSGSQEAHLAAFAPALRTYVEGGGGVVFAGMIYDDANCCFSVDADIESVSPVSLSDCWMCPDSATVQITAADPVTTGVNDFDLSQMFPAYTLTNGGVQLGDSSNDPGAITIASTTIISGRSVFLGMPYLYDNDDAGGWGADPTIYDDVDAQALLRNAISWTSGSLNMDASIDIGDDGDLEWSAVAFSGNQSLADFTDELNSLLASLPVTDTDAYGNQMVRIPLALQGSSTGLVGLGTLHVEYDYLARVHDKPVSDLEAEIDAALSPSPSTVMVSFPIGLQSTTAGVLTLSQLEVIGTPPPHPPHFEEVSPDTDAFSLPENSTQLLHAVPGDDYGNPTTLRWQLDDVDVSTSDNYTYAPGFDDAGTHRIEAIADNGLQTATHLWEVTVTDVNRPPVVLGVSPALDAQVPEATTTVFKVNATDPDGDQLTYRWFEDGVSRTTEFLGTFSATYDYKGAGPHHIKVQVVDADNEVVERQWDITVLDVNARTRIISSRPSDGVTIAELQDLTFAVTAHSPDSDPITYRWELDGTALSAQTTSTTTYIATFDDAGTHTMLVVVNDGHQPVEVHWNFTVTDLNRPPTTSILSPLADAKVVRGQLLHLQAADQADPDGDPLSFVWRIDNKQVATEREADITVDARDGRHSLSLEVSDGRGGLATADLTFEIASLTFTGRLFSKSEDLVADRDVPLRVELTNTGSATADNVPVRVLLDGVSVHETTLATTKPRQVHSVPFSIKTSGGEHTLTVEVAGAVVLTKTLEVSSTPSPLNFGPGGDGGFSMLLLVLLLLVVAGAVVGIVVMRRRRTAASAPPPMAPSHAPYGTGTGIGLPPMAPDGGTPYNPYAAPPQATVVSASYGTASPGTAIPPTAGFGTAPPGAYGNAPASSGGGPGAPGLPGGNPLLTATPTTPDQVNAYLNEVEALMQQKAASGTDVQRANAQMTLARNHQRAGRLAQAHQAAKQAYVRLR